MKLDNMREHEILHLQNIIQHVTKYLQIFALLVQNQDLIEVHVRQIFYIVEAI